MKRNNRRVVITGLGVISSIGIGKADFWKNLIAGKSGISPIEAFDTSAYERHFGGEVKNFHAEEFIDKRKLKHMGRASQLALAAARLALDDAGLNIKKSDKEKAGVCVGTTMGEAQILEEMDKLWVDKGEKHVDYKTVILFPTYSIVANLANELQLKANSFMFANACSAGNYSIGYAFDLIRSDKADIMLAGGVDAFSRVNLVGFSRLYAMAPEVCRPFDLNREGMLVGEGAGVLLLETLDSALKRKANIYAEVLGYGLSCDAYHMTAPKEEGIVECMKRGIKETDIKIEDVDYISAHGTGTVQNDKTECSAIKKVFGSRYKEIPVSSIKSMLGHTMGAAAAIEAISCCLSIKEGVIAPTINYQTPDPECDIDCVPNEARRKEVKIALNNSYAFGGNNACLVLRKV
jgi:3-oxoacyl-[acyl-carrier-protein] synthase II